MAAARGPNHSEDDIISAINITPLMDIAFILLIIFMVSANYILTPSIKIDLPRAANADDAKRTTTITFVMSKQGDVFVNGKQTPWSEFRQTVGPLVETGRTVTAVISADKDVSHGGVIHLIDTIKGLGIVQFALNIEQVEYQSEEQLSAGTAAAEG